MQTQALELNFGQPLPPADPQHIQNRQHYAQNAPSNSDNTRSRSRSTEGTDNTEASHSNTAINEPSVPISQPVQNLGMALQHATLDTQTFTGFNNPDLFPFQPNSLLQYPMLSSFGRNPQMNAFESKPDVGQLQSQMQMREAKPYKCTQCVKSFANSSYLSQHMRIHLGIKPFGPCQYCGKKFTQLSHLQQHIRTHTGEKPYKCKYTGCEKAFSQLSNLQSHSRCHQTDKPFKCNSCYKCFSDEQSLLEHIPKHKESKHLKVHICPFCGKSYTQATYLQKHMTKHADRTRANPLGGFRPDFPVDQLDLNSSWNGLQMPDNSHTQQFDINHFANQAMMSQAVANHSNPYNNPALQNSAFTQLLNFQRNANAAAVTAAPRYNFDYPANTKASDRPAGFNMITPLENIQRYTQQGGSTASSHQQFSSSIINQMKPY